MTILPQNRPKENFLKQTNTKMKSDIVTNLSKLELSRTERSVLNRGFTFVPTPSLDEVARDIDISKRFCQQVINKILFP